MSASLLSLLVACASEDDGNILGDRPAAERDTGESGDSDDESGGGDTDADADADAYIQAVAESMVEDQSGMSLDESTATCIARAAVELVGVDELTAASVTPEDFTDADTFSDLDVELPDDAATELADNLAECDVGAVLRDEFVAQFSGETSEELSADAVACLDGALDNEAFARALAEAFLGGSEESFDQEFLSAIASCPDVITAILVSEFDGDLTPADEDCIRSVVEANPDVVEEMVSNEDSSSGEAMGELIAGECPGIDG